MTVRLLGGVAVVILVLALVIYGGHGLIRVLHMKADIEALERDLAALRAQSEKLTATVEQLRNDPAYVEKLAREELGMVREGETVLKFRPQGR